MLHTEFKASEPSGSEEEDFLIFFLYIFFMISILDPQVQDHLGPSDLHFIKLDKGPLSNATYQIPASKPSNSEEEDF